VLSSSDKGIFWALGSVVFITSLGLVVKHMGALGVGVAIIVLLQSLVIWALSIPVLARHGLPAFRTRHARLHAFRALLSMLSFGTLVYALANLNLADAVALSFSIPLWSIPLSVLFLGEGVRVRRWTATVVGFLGVLCIVRPGGDFEWAMLIALGGAALGSGAKIATKRLTTTETIPQILFFYSLFATLFALPAALWFWHPLSAEQWGWLMVAGVLGFLGQYCMARSFASADLTIVGPMDFVRMPLSAVLGIFLFGELPDLFTVLGMAIIGAASIYLARRGSPPGAPVEAPIAAPIAIGRERSP
jgi:drug/metabolite transporter (DMT)-like permease